MKLRYLHSILKRVWVLLAFSAGILAKEAPLEILITANLEGRFAIREDTNDYMLALARNLLHEQRQNPGLIYIDGGNAFSPGLLTRFSHGSLMYSFFELTSPRAVSVNSRDIRLSADLLDFFQARGKVPLTSANINKNGKPMFSVFTRANDYAIISISSHRSSFDAADAELFSLELADSENALRNALAAASAAGFKKYIVLSGRSPRDTLSLMSRFTQVKVWIASGNAATSAYENEVKQIKNNNGSYLFFPSQNKGYYKIFWEEGDEPDFQFITVNQNIESTGLFYRSFENRLNLWRQRLRKEKPEMFTEIKGQRRYSSESLMRFVREQNNCDIGLADQGVMSDSETPPRERIEVLERLRDETFIFRCELRGAQIPRLNLPAGTRLQGASGGKIHNWPTRGGRIYSLCLAQRHLKDVLQKLENEVDCVNTWKTYTDHLDTEWERTEPTPVDEPDLQTRPVGELELHLANFIESVSIRRGDLANPPPPGRPAESYFKWGLENTINARVYNGKHEFTFTPYLNYSRQDDIFLQNLLRFTGNYRYQWLSWMMPYAQSRYETALVENNGLRPSFARQTGGLTFAYNLLEGKLGVGYEKRLRDPETEPVLGFDTQLKWEWQILTGLMFRFHWEAFFFRDFQTPGESLSVRSEMSNRLSYAVLSFMDVTFAHRWFYFSDPGRNDLYDNTQFTVSADLRTSLRFDF